MAKIPKNLSDKSMFGEFQEEITFENDIFSDDTTVPKQVKPMLRK